MQSVIRIFTFGLFLFLTFNRCIAQRKPLLPDGNTRTTTLALQPFQELRLRWLGGKIEVEFGADTSILEIIADENILQLIETENTAGTLRIEVKGNEQNRLWLEDDKTMIKIKVSAQPDRIEYRCNANANMLGIKTDKLYLEKDMNGDLTLNGSAAALVIGKTGNGSIFASQLQVNTADVQSDGNGDLQLTVQQFERRETSGNGVVGNSTDAPADPAIPLQRVQVTLFNNRARKQEFYVTGENGAGRSFSYGLSLGAYAKHRESLPPGTKVYLGDRSGRLLVTLSEKDDHRTIGLFE